jgi:formiminotetrahydrofolate cyclodeaminase
LQKVTKLSGKQWPEAAEMHERAERLRIQSEELIEQDSMAYLDYVEAVRSGQGVAGAQARTIQIPLEIARAAADVAALAEQSASLGNPKLRADAVVAAMLASAAAGAAAYLVRVNLGESADIRLDEARRLAAEASARLRPPGARGSAGGRGRGRVRPADSRRR